MAGDNVALQPPVTSTSPSMSSSYPNGVNNGNASKSQPPPPPPKTDKPRPHVCATCTRSFARLEHLKRHERSHTKEKPFECPECTRCFARRDLLLRHQQKLHMTTTPSSRPRAGGRRESTSSVASTTGRVRKNSISTTTVPVSAGDGGASTMRARPRANTIAHVDSSTLGMIAAANANVSRGRNGIAAQANMGGIGFGSHNHEETRHAIPKIDTSINSLDLGGMMPRSATILPSEFDLEGLFFSHQTVNPAALHFNMSPLQQPIGTPTSPFGSDFPGMHSSSYYSIDDEDDYEWMNVLGGGSLLNEPVDQSSPSAFSTTSASGISELMLNDAVWGTGGIGINSTGSSMNYSPSTDFTTPNFNDTPPPDPLSISPSGMPPGFSNYNFPNQEAPPAGSNSMSSCGSSLISLAAESVTEATRAALNATITQQPGFNAQGNQQNYHSPRNQRRYSTSAQSSPVNTGFPTVLKQVSAVGLPSTKDLQRYVAAYIKYFHPHLPFLHIPTLNFNSPTFTSSYKGGQRNGGVTGGGGCLILSITAIGALYEFEPMVARELFEAAKRSIQLFLEDRRKADVSAAISGMHTSSSNGSDSSNNTPVWLVQAMLLNVIYGLQCGDRAACEIAVTHCGALVSLARSAGLTRPTTIPAMNSVKQEDGDIQMGDLDLGSFDGSVGSDGWGGLGIKMEADENVEWTSWIMAEERKRTLYAVHFLSSFLVAAHNLSPALMNNEIRLDLPCNEELWSSHNATEWQQRGGLVAASKSSVSFASALNGLLSTGQQQYGPPGKFQNFTNGQQGGIPPYPPSGIIPSTFGCLVLICALHVYIWETRQRHLARHWTSAEAEAMHAHIEPALKAWQAAWYSSPHHSIERPNPYSMGPLSADSIPLLDLAYIRLFVDLGRAKEFFWARDYEAMAEEIARGWDNGQITSSSASSTSAQSDASFSGAISPASSPASTSPSPSLRPIKMEPGTSFTNNGIPVGPNGACSKREKHLRKAAFYAADSLAMSDTLGASTSSSSIACRELPIQSALCTFDCAQVLAEWIATVQERVGPYIGTLGSEKCEIGGIEGMMMLEAEDRKLIGKVMDMLQNAQAKMTMDGYATQNGVGIINADIGLGPKVLRVSAYLLDKVVVWPATRLMAQALRSQADHMEGRTGGIITHHMQH